MDNKKLIIIGASGHAKVIIDVFERMGDHEILGLLDDAVPKGTDILGHAVLGTTDYISQLLAVHEAIETFIAIGDNWIRARLKEKLMKNHPNIRWARAIHPTSSICKNAKLGDGVAVLAGAVVNSESTLGDYSIIGSNACLDHEGELGAYASLAPGCNTGGNVKIGNYSAIGVGVNIMHGRKIGEHVIIGAGATVLDDFGDQLVVYGSPAKKIRTRNKGEKYL